MYLLPTLIALIRDADRRALVFPGQPDPGAGRDRVVRRHDPRLRSRPTASRTGAGPAPRADAVAGRNLDAGPEADVRHRA